jgi:hypothetical protein
VAVEADLARLPVERERDVARHRLGLVVREHAGAGERLSHGQRDHGDVPQRVHAGEAGLHGVPVHLHPAALVGEAGSGERARRADGRDPGEEIEPGAEAVRELELPSLHPGDLVLGAVLDPLPLDHPADGRGGLRARHAHRPGLRGEERELDRVADAAPAARRLDQHGRLVGSGGALVGGRGGEDDDPAAAEARQLVAQAGGALQRAEGVSGRGEPRDRVEGELGPERQDEPVAAERPPAHHRLAARRIDPLHLALHHLDALAREPLERARHLARGARPGHHPQERGGQRDRGLAVDEDDAVSARQPLPERVGRGHAADAAAQDQDVLRHGALLPRSGSRAPRAGPAQEPY